jgi:hypothetical protein
MCLYLPTLRAWAEYEAVLGRLGRMSFIRLLLGVLMLPVACTARARAPAPTPGGASYRAVHIDSLAPDKVTEFVDARRAWVAELQLLGTTDGRGLFIQAGESRFYTLRPLSDFASLDTRSAAVERALTSVPKAAGDVYDERSDAALIFPHTSEVWQLDDDLAYAPAGGALTEKTAACGRMIIEDARPDPAMSRRYRRATSEIHRALGEARYPLTRITFRTRFGAGHLVTMWLARSPEDLAVAPAIEAAVATVRGAARASELQKECEAAVERRQELPIVVRHDLSSAPIP